MSMTAAGSSFGILGMLAGFGADKRASKRATNIALWQANQQQADAFAEANDTGAALVRQLKSADKVFEVNFDIAGHNADLAMMQGHLTESRTLDQVDRVVGGQQAFFAGGNIDLNYGSPLTMAAATAAQGEMDVQLAKATALNTVAGARMQQQSIAMQRADAYESTAIGIDSAYAAASRRGSSAMAAGIINATSQAKASMYGSVAGLLSGANTLAKFAMGAK